MRFSTSRNLTHWLLLAAASLSLSACKEEAKGISVEDFIEGWSSTVCEAVVTCNCEYPNGALLDHCASQLSVLLDSSSEVNGAEGLSFDGECAEKAIGQVDALNCGVPVGDPNAACERPCKIWHGPTGTGGACQSYNGADSCAQGLVCSQNGVCVDPCAEPDLPNAGEACAPQIGCDELSFCDAATDPIYPVCVALPSNDQPCAEYLGEFYCAPSHICDEFTDPANPLCKTLPTAGQECIDFACASGLYCDANLAPSVCTALPVLGEDCWNGVCQAPYQCGEGSICVDPQPAVCSYYGGLPTQNCSGVEFTCANGGCIPETAECDGTPDCSDSSDEAPQNPACGGGGSCEAEGLVTCAGTIDECIPPAALCDAASDCLDGWDESPNVCG